MKNYTVSIIVFLFLGIIISLFPPVVWNHKYQKPILGSNSVIYKDATPYKEYDFLFGYNRKAFYSDASKDYEWFTRTVIMNELAIEYILALFVALLSQYSLSLIRKTKK